MRVVSYNIQYCKGRDGKIDPHRVVDSVREADIIAFQEIESSTQFSELANSLGNHWIDYRYENSDWGELSYLFNSETITFTEPYSILNEYQNNYPKQIRLLIDQKIFSSASKNFFHLINNRTTKLEYR